MKSPTSSCSSICRVLRGARVTSWGALLSMVVSALLLAGPANAQPGLDDVPALAGLKQRWLDAMDNLRVPGCAVAVLQGGEIIAMEGLGMRNIDGDPVDADTGFYIASITKTYVAAAVVALAEQGLIDLDAPVSQYLPRFKLAGDSGARITVRDLLCHRAGLDSSPIVILDAYSGEITEDRYYHWLELSKPVGHVEYTNVNFTVAGRIIEAVTGESWKDHLAAKLFAPLGLERTTAYASKLYNDANTAAPMATEKGEWVECKVRKTDSTMHAAGGLGTTARDAAGWILAQRPGGGLESTGLLSPAARENMQTQQGELPSPNGQIRRITGYGLGWQVGTFRGRPYRNHGGGYVGTATLMAYLPDDDIGVAILTNSMMGGALNTIVSIDVFDRLLGETGHPDMLPQYEGRAAQMLAQNDDPGQATLGADSLSLEPKLYAGRYSSEHWGTVEITLVDNSLAATMGTMSFTFQPVSTDRFGIAAGMGGGALEFDAAFLPDDHGGIATLFLGDDEQLIRFDRVTASKQ